MNRDTCCGRIVFAFDPAGPTQRGNLIAGRPAPARKRRVEVWQGEGGAGLDGLDGITILRRRGGVSGLALVAHKHNRSTVGTSPEAEKPLVFAVGASACMVDRQRRH